MCGTFQMSAHTLFVSLVMDKHCLVLSLYPSYLQILNSVTIIRAFFVNYSPPQIGTRVRLIRVYEAFTETNFTHVFLFLIYDVYVTTVPSSIK